MVSRISRHSRWWLTLLLLSWATRTNAQSELSEEARFSLATNLYDAGQYGECSKKFAELLDGSAQLKSPRLVQDARIYRAACLMGVGKQKEADRWLEEAIRADPLMKPPNPMLFPPPVITRFAEIQTKLRDEIEAAEAARRAAAAAADAARKAKQAKERERIRKITELAQEESVVYKNSRWLAAVPFGVGQFQNRQTALGVVFLSTEALALGAAITALVVDSQLAATIDDDPPPKESELNASRNAWHGVFVASSYTFLGVAALGILHAELTFVPEFRTTRQRSLPPELRPPPDNGVSLKALPVGFAGGGGLGIIGRF